MPEKDLRRALRLASKENRLGQGATCERCGESDFRVLQRTDGETLCAECRLDTQGKPRLERHHPAGRHNDPFIVPIPANDHAVMSDFQIDWPEETLRNPQGDVLHRRAAWLRSNRDSLMHQAIEVETWATELEELADFLSDEWRPDWYERFHSRMKEKDK